MSLEAFRLNGSYMPRNIICFPKCFSNVETETYCARACLNQKKTGFISRRADEHIQSFQICSVGF